MVQNVLAIPTFPRSQSEGPLRCHALKGKKSLDILVKQNIKKIDVGQNIKERCQLYRGMHETFRPVLLFRLSSKRYTVVSHPK